MAETYRAPGVAALRAERLEELLAALAAAPGVAAAASTLTDAFAGAVGARGVLLYLLEEEERALRLVARSAVGGLDLAPARVAQDDARAQPLFAAAASLFVLSTESGSPVEGLPGGAWVLVPLPQPRLSWSSAPVDVAAAVRRAGDGWQALTPSHGERRGRVGLAPFGVAAVQLAAGTDADATAAADALVTAATLAGPMLSRGVAVEQYREAAERIDRQRDLLSELIDSLPDPVLLTGAAARTIGDVLVQNRRAKQLLEAGPEAGAEERRAADANAQALGTMLATPTTPGSVPRELSLVDPAGAGEQRFEVCDHELRRGEDREDARLVVLRDVTALRRAGEQLERQVERARLAEREATRERDRLDRILDYVADPIVVTDALGAVVESNQQAARLLGEAGGRDADGRKGDNRRAFTAFVRGMGSGGVRRARLALVHPATGNPLPVEVVAGSVAGPTGEAPVVVSVLHDLTTQVENERLYEELKRFSAVLEARVRAATSDLAERNARLQWQSDELERASRLKSEFLASMSHELRTPINALIGYTALLRDRVYGDLTQKQEDGLRRIQTSAEHLLALINDILDLARIEAGRMPVHLERTQLAPLLRTATAPTEAQAHAKGLSFTLALPDEPVAVHTDPEKLRQVLGNLLSNALKFTAQGGITVRAERVGDRVRITVADTGIGIRAEDLALIWEDFRQLDQSRTREYGGTGLGLSIVRKLAERLGADVSVESAPEVGSTFSVTVPATDDPLPAAPPAA
jgi:PAS domain S-box-containing protein